jgi:hypothetical protein
MDIQLLRSRQRNKMKNGLTHITEVKKYGIYGMSSQQKQL